MVQVREEAQSRSGADAAGLLRALSQRAPAGTQWQQEFARLQEVLRLQPQVPGAVPGLLHLALAQHSCRGQYLALLETLCPAAGGVDASVAAELSDSEPLLRDWVRFDQSARVRQAAARLLAATGGSRVAGFLHQCLRLEKHPEVAAGILAAIHPLEAGSGDPHWRGVLSQFLTLPNPRAVRLQAGCCCLEVDRRALPVVMGELAGLLYCPQKQTASQAIGLIARYGRALPRTEAVRLWIHLLTVAAEFDGAAEMASQLMRAACDDRREGWGTVRLSSVSVGEAGAAAEWARRTWTGMFRRLTGRAPRLAAGHLPVREYPGVTGFPPPVDPDDACHRAALLALAECEPLWGGHAGLWRHFGLPDDRAALRELCRAATPPQQLRAD